MPISNGPACTGWVNSPHYLFDDKSLGLANFAKFKGPLRILRAAGDPRPTATRIDALLENVGKRIDLG